MNKIVQGYCKWYRAILGFAILFTVVCGVYASDLQIDADLERLLPEQQPSVQGLRKLDAEYGIIGRISIVLEGSKRESLQNHADLLAKHLETVEGISRTESQRPTAFFQSNRMLYLDLADVETVHGRIAKRIKWEKQRANPLFVDLGKNEKPSLDMSDIEAKYPQQQADTYYCTKPEAERQKCIVFLFPAFSAGNLAETRTLLDEVRKSTDTYIASADDSLTYGVSGRYQKRIGQTDALTKDLGMGTAIALTLLLLFLLFYFNGLSTSVVVLIPLIMGTTWAFAYARLAFENLNILTGFFGAVLLGLGIDYGIHIVSRFLEAQSEYGVEESLAQTLRSAGRASIFAGITTVVAFGSLMTSSFLAFFEYGAIALGGMTLVVIANVVVLPCLLIALSGTRIAPKPTASVKLAKRAHKWRIVLQSRRSLLAVVFSLVVVTGFVGLYNVGFEYDFSKIQNTDIPSWDLDNEIDEILGISQIPVVFLVDGDEEAARVAEEISARKKTMPEAWTVDQVVTRQDVLPNNQSKKLELISDLNAKFSKLPQRVIKDEVKSFRNEIAKLKSPVTFNDLPDSVRSPLSMREGSNGRVVLVFPTIAQHDAKEMMDLAKVIRNVPTSDETTTDGINDSLLLVDILNSVQQDSVKMLVITLLGLLLTAILAFRDPRRVAILVGTIAIATVTATGWVGIVGLKFNFINMLTIPIWLGLGVDAAFHLMVRTQDAPGDHEGFLATVFAVGAAFITSMIGFGAMLVTSHGGLFSMGAIACVGLGMILFVSLYIQWNAFERESE